MIDFDGAVLAPVSTDAAQLPMLSPPPPDEGSTLFLAGALPSDVNPVLLLDTAGEGDEWIAIGLATSSSHAFAIALADPGDLGMVTPLSNEGDEEQEIVITGDRGPNDDWMGAGAGGTGGSGDSGSGGTSGGNADSDTEPNDCRDREALEAQTAIKNDSNHGTKEHGVVIYRGADGAVHSSPVFEGEKDRIDVNLFLNWLSQNGIDINQVLGIAHNHDAWWYGATEDSALINRYPSINDWNVANYFVSRGAGGAGGTNFALYVMDVDDNMREFKYSDKTDFDKLSLDDKKRGVDLPDETESDGSTC